MIYYLLLPVLLLILVIVQTTILELFSLGRIGIEISLIVAVYAGFHLDAFRGGVISLLLGFFMDCLTSPIFGLFMFLYILIFSLSMAVEGKVYTGKPALIATFTGMSMMLEGLVIVLLYRFVFGADISYALLKIFIPQAVVLAILSPFIFRLLRRFEVFVHAEDRPSAQRI